jgi:hypothetical protein
MRSLPSSRACCTNNSARSYSSSDPNAESAASTSIFAYTPRVGRKTESRVSIVKRDVSAPTTTFSTSASKGSPVSTLKSVTERSMPMRHSAPAPSDTPASKPTEISDRS